jgi:hypothetical protein
MQLRKTLASLVLLVSAAFAQAPAGSLLTIVTEHVTTYRRDVTDYSLLASQPGPTNLAGPPRTFGETILIGDIVSVNGRPAKGTQTGIVTIMTMGPNPAPGEAIADVTRTARAERNFDIQDEDGRPIGSIRTSGMVGGPPPPGATQEIKGAAFVVVGGTGAFLGARGYSGGIGGDLIPARMASMSEDPATRRLLGGGTEVHKIYILPLFQPEIITVSGSPAIVHANDSSLVTTAKPARPGEILTLFASGLGPTRPGVEPGQPFPMDSLQTVNSPVEVLVNGVPGEVLYAGGYPGAVDRYQVNFRAPEGATAGSTSVQVISAWIGGSTVQIPFL